MPLEPQRVQRCEKTASERVCLMMCVVYEYLGIKPIQSNGCKIDDVKMVCLMDDGSEQASRHRFISSIPFYCISQIRTVQK